MAPRTFTRDQVQGLVNATARKVAGVVKAAAREIVKRHAAKSPTRGVLLGPVLIDLDALPEITGVNLEDERNT